MGNYNAGFIYLMNAAGTDLYKIGVMSSLDNRIADVRSQHPSFQIQYERSLRVNDMKEAKNYFYTKFADYRYDLLDKFSNITEWFLFPPAVLDQVLSEFDEDKIFEEEPTTYTAEYDAQYNRRISKDDHVWRDLISGAIARTLLHNTF
ncbi:GIY-YIG nuclease family protein [Leptolyngbya sp. FACHB-671]|uniref:GIY-YIG nuclease family protein n=1 Tax=Leptolyngbya sp. FACHB-671 TaxID=2692812 RepID=UPI001682DAA8|nr:GIY-YIG nuclease family protein [Leptolyngbya sp. FACHB-671]MBD2068096.1 GIY-YIG nuclease family protein [Leptolyngbya sp. FACHB-671]